MEKRKGVSVKIRIGKMTATKKKLRISNLIIGVFVLMTLTGCSKEENADSSFPQNYQTITPIKEDEAEDTEERTEETWERTEENPEWKGMISDQTFSVNLGGWGEEYKEYMAFLAGIDSSNGIDRQMEIIAANLNQCVEDAFYVNEVYQYTVTDLDQNGRLEMIISVCGGTGNYTYSSFYEVNESFDSLVNCPTDFREGDSQADIMDDTVSAFYDADMDVYRYIFSDLARDGANYYENVRAITLKDGQISQTPLAYRNSVYYTAGDPVIITCTDASDHEITEEEYRNIGDTVFADLRKYSVNFKWHDMNELDGKSEEEIIKLLGESYNGFTFNEI